ncbi:hypothetical protein [Synechococcus sp. R3-13]|uniref:hypothetical protein n=1 Tax=Synechococcus sp. R3-13 TaxID=2421316 RepID=UPI0039C3B473
MLAQSSCALGFETTEAIVQALLRLDQDPVRVSGTESLSKQQETTLRGIRKTQVRLAAYCVSGTESLELLWISGASLKNSADRVSGTESLSSLVRAAPC